MCAFRLCADWNWTWSIWHIFWHQVSKSNSHKVMWYTPGAPPAWWLAVPFGCSAGCHWMGHSFLVPPWPVPPGSVRQQAKLPSNPCVVNKNQLEMIYFILFQMIIPQNFEKPPANFTHVQPISSFMSTYRGTWNHVVLMLNQVARLGLFRWQSAIPKAAPPQFKPFWSPNGDVFESVTSCHIIDSKKHLWP